MLVALFSFSSCMKRESFPDIPEIEFAGYLNLYDTGQFARKGVLSITFHDGNGDIGLNARDTSYPYQRGGDYYYNYIINYYEKQNGTFVKIDLDPPLNARIPVLTPDDPNRAIKGIIIDTLELNPHPLYDTIQLELFIYDRALNKSNVVFTPAILLRKQ